MLRSLMQVGFKSHSPTNSKDSYPLLHNGEMYRSLFSTLFGCRSNKLQKLYDATCWGPLD